MASDSWVAERNPRIGNWKHKLETSGRMVDAGFAIDWDAELEQHRPWLRRVLCGRIGHRHEVDDLLQEIAVAVFKQKALPEDPAKVAPWLYRLAVRQAINFHRKMGRKSTAKPTADLELTSTDNEPLDWMLNVEQNQAMREAIGKLCVRDREMLMLKYTENWSYQKLANHLGIKVKTVEYRLMKARKQLRSLILSKVGMPRV